MFIFNLFGPALKYRLDVFDYCSPDIKDYVIIMTDKKSYPFYKDYHSKYEFVFIDDIERNELSLKCELLPSHFNTEEDHLKNLTSFYSENNANYPYDINRFCFEFMIKKGITNFCIIDSDTSVINDKNKVKEFFESIPKGSTYAPFYIYEQTEINQKNKFWNEVKELFNIDMDLTIPSIDLNSNLKDLFNSGKIGCINDGYQKGFHFRSIEDMKVFYNIWDSAMRYLMKKKIENPIDYSGDNMALQLVSDGRNIWSSEFVCSNIFFFFQRSLNYKHISNIVMNPGDTYSYNPNIANPFGMFNKLICRHRPKPEDNLYYGKLSPRGAWFNYIFDYSNITSIKDFIKNNKDKLKEYYTEYGFEVEVTDTHVYPKLKLYNE